jgi:hypothetical protein
VAFSQIPPTSETDEARELAVMNGRSASRAGVGFGAPRGFWGMLGHGPTLGLFGDALMRRGWGALALMTPLNSGIRLSFRQP